MLIDKPYYDYDYKAYKKELRAEDIHQMNEGEIADLVGMFVGKEESAEELQNLTKEG
jgi:hypothetical protein